MTITEFLNARYDEEERRAGVYHKLAEELGSVFGLPAPLQKELPIALAAQVAIARTSARILADIAAKRAIVALHGPGDEHTWGGPDDTECRTCADTGADEGGDGDTVIYANPESFPCQTVRLLAQPFAEHADFDPAWRT